MLSHYKQQCADLSKLTATLSSTIGFLMISYFIFHSPKPGRSQRKYIVTRVVTRSSCGNALHSGLSMFVEPGNVW